MAVQVGTGATSPPERAGGVGPPAGVDSGGVMPVEHAETSSIIAAMAATSEAPPSGAVLVDPERERKDGKRI